MSDPENHLGQCWKFPAVVRRVIDGDTLVVDIDQGRGQWWHGAKIRLVGIDCPEMNTDAGTLARGFVCSLCPLGSPCYVQTHSADNFGRWLGTLWVGETKRSLQTILVESDHAITWEPKRLATALAGSMKGSDG